MKHIKKIIAPLLIIAMMAIALSGCSPAASSSDSASGNAPASDSSSDKDNQPTSKTVKIGVVNWSDCIAITNLVKVILEDDFNYTVETTMVDAGPVYASVASGDYDAYLDGWLPSTHANYMEKFDGKIEAYSTIFEGTKNGLVVPAYVDVDSIEDLNAHKDEFDGKIVGIDSGAGIMGQANNAIEDYDLDFNLQTSSGPVMTAALADAIANEKPIVVTGWQPHWMFGKWDLKFLDDPNKDFGDAEYIKSVVRLGFKEDLPEFAAFLDNFSLSSDQLADLMSRINDSDEDPEVVARAWVQDNQDAVNTWIEGIE